KSAVPQKLRSGNARRKSVMNALMSSRPRRGSCREYCRSMAGAGRAGIAGLAPELGEPPADDGLVVLCLAHLDTLPCLCREATDRNRVPVRGIIRDAAAQTPFLAANIEIHRRVRRAHRTSGMISLPRQR